MKGRAMDYQDNKRDSTYGDGSGMGSVGGQTPAPPMKKKSGWRIFWGIFLALSVFANIVFFLMILGLGAILFAGQADVITERVLVPGPASQKIAMIRLQGVIDSARAEDIVEQIQRAAKDASVKALIINVDSPGGTISGSDQIYNEIMKYRHDTARPVVGFMQNLAASGGYYVSVATQEIVAEPTTITGSIGVIMGYMVLQDLLEGKLGIQPVIIKSGLRKDWPSSFRKPSDEELAYFQTKIIDPAFERFKNVVADGRSELTIEDVNRLADGSIFWADEALNEKLIDQIGYFDEAVDSAKKLAGLKQAKVVEYTRPLSFLGLFRSQAEGILKFDRSTIYELSTPQVLYLWSMH
jgi:protease-4